MKSSSPLSPTSPNFHTRADPWASTGAVAAGDDEVGTVLGGVEHGPDELRRMLQVGVHDADEATLGHAQPADDGGAQAALPLLRRAQQAADGPRVLLGQPLEDLG